MAKTKTTKNASDVSSTVDLKVSNVSPPVNDPAPVLAKKSKASKMSKKDVAPSPESELVTPISVTTPSVTTKDSLSEVVSQPTTAVVDPIVPPALLSDNTIVVLLSELASLEQQESVIQQKRRIKRRLLEKAVVKLLKLNNKAANKKQKRSGNRQPSGFIRPTLISDELASFLGKEFGTEMARTAVTNQINNYIKLNNLKDSKNGRQINADEKLSTLLKLGKDDVLTYFNLQKFMKHHFVKKADAVVDTVQSVAV